MIKKFKQFINERVETSSHRLNDLMNYFEKDIEEKIKLLPDFFRKYMGDEDIFHDWVGDNWIYDEEEDPDHQFGPDDVLTLAREFPDQYKEYCEYLYSILTAKNFHFKLHKLPLFMTYTFEDDVHDKWMVHFTGDVETVNLILQEGFKGISNFDDLAFTGADEEGLYSDGYCFAFDFDDAYYNFSTSGMGHYGNHGVIFRANGVKLWHDGDKELQTIFIGNEAKDLYGFYYKDGKYVSANEKIGSKSIGHIIADDFDDFINDFESKVK